MGSYRIGSITRYEWEDTACHAGPVVATPAAFTPGRRNGTTGIEIGA